MLKYIPLLAALVLSARADLVEQGPKDAKPSGLLAGLASADITPPVGIVQQNWGSQTHVAAAGIDPARMYVKALVLSDGRQKFAIVDIDAGGLGGLEDAAPRASELTGIPAEHIRLSASHTHAGPALQTNRGPVGMDLTPYQRPFATFRAALVDKVVGAIVQAHARLRPAHLYGGRGTGTININRRFRAQGDRPAAVGLNPEGFVDRELIVVRIDDAEGRPVGVLFNFPCHGTVMGYENTHISPDWVGSARRAVEHALPGSTALFLQGAAGNQGPVEGYTGDLNVARRLGSILGYQAAAVALGIDTVRREPRFEGFVESTAYQARQPWRVQGPRDSTLKFASRVLELSPRTYSRAELDEMSRLVEDARRRVDAARGDAWKEHQAQARFRRLNDLLARWRATQDPPPVKVRVQALRIGEVALVAMAGEPFAEIGVAVKKASPFAVTAFSGYSNGPGGGYMPVASEYPHGGYEVQMTPYGDKAAEQLVRHMVALLGELRGSRRRWLENRKQYGGIEKHHRHRGRDELAGGALILTASSLL